MEKPKWLDPKSQLPDFNCDCWTAYRITYKEYDYKSMELLRKSDEIYEEVLEIDDGKFEMPSLITEYGMPKTNPYVLEEMFKRISPYEFHAQMLDHGNKKVNWSYLVMTDIEILGYVILPEDWKGVNDDI